MKNLFAKHFEERFKEDEKTKWMQLGSMQLSRINHKEAEFLELGFSDEEIVVALAKMNNDKAPGPDGFNAKYIKSMSKFLHSNFTEILNAFHFSASLPPGINSSFLALNQKLLNLVLSLILDQSA